MVSESDPETSPPDAPPSVVTRVAVYGTVTLTVLLALGLITVTGIRWMLQPTPSSIVVVQSDAALAGASIIVAREGEKPRTAITIARESNGQTPLFLENGSYTIRVEKGEQVVYRTDRPFYVAAGRRYDIDLRTLPLPTTRP
jgi:hypothetical protein